MKLSVRTKRFLPMIPLSLAGLSAILQALAYLVAYEAPKANYFQVGSPLPILAVIFALLACAAGVIIACLLPRQPQPERLPASSLCSIPAAIGFLSGAVALYLSVSGKLVLPAVALLAISAAYHLLTAFLPNRFSAITALVGFAAVIGTILLNAIYYFDTSLEMNAPLKISVLVGLLCVMIYQTGELRYLLDRAMPRTFLGYCSALLGIGALSALPIPFAFLIGKFARSTTPARAPLLAKQFFHPEYLAGALVILGVAVTAALRLYALIKAASLDAPAEQAEGPSLASDIPECTEAQEDGE